MPLRLVQRTAPAAGGAYRPPSQQSNVHLEHVAENEVQRRLRWDERPRRGAVSGCGALRVQPVAVTTQETPHATRRPHSTLGGTHAVRPTEHAAPYTPPDVVGDSGTQREDLRCVETAEAPTAWTMLRHIPLTQTRDVSYTMESGTLSQPWLQPTFQED